MFPLVRLAYADPPYPGMAHLYPENTEVDHAELIGRLVEYDGWALSTDERSLAAVLELCPPRTRVLAWCRTNAPPFRPNPSAAWEPVLLRPARSSRVIAQSFYVGGMPSGKWQRQRLTGQKTTGFAQWVFRCLGAEAGDELDDLFPGTGVMSEAWTVFQRQPQLFTLDSVGRSSQAIENDRRRFHPMFDGIDSGKYKRERHGG